MKDWKAEYDKLRGQFKAVEDDRDYLRRELERRRDEDALIRDRFKQLLIDVLGR